MRAKLLLKSREPLGLDRFVERVVWELAQPLSGSGHTFKYRLAFVVKGVCVIRFDNEAGKGDHRHVGVGSRAHEIPYGFVSLEQLLADFWHDVDNWRPAE